MGGDAFSLALELPRVGETQARGKKRDDRSGLVSFQGERRRGPWLIVVFEKSGQFILIIQPGVEVLAHGPRMAFTEAVVQALVVGVVEPLLLERPFQVPI